MESAGGKTGGNLKNLGNNIRDLTHDVDRSTNSHNNNTSSVSKAEKALKNYTKRIDSGGLGGALKAFLKPLMSLFKPLLLLSAEFAAMVGVMGLAKLALVSGRIVAKAYSASLLGIGAAAGVAVGAIAGVLSVMRELKVAQMQPLFIKANDGKKATGATSGAARMQQFYGDSQLGFFGEAALSGAISSQMKAGGKADGAYKAQLTRYADFSGGDPKALQSIAGAMSTAQYKGTGKMKGKISGDTYSEMKKSAPGMAEAFEEMAGGADKAQAAAASGKISFEAFNTALMEGKLKALVPYEGALAAINNTVMGKVKTGIASLKESLTSIGTGSWEEVYGVGAGYNQTGASGNVSILGALSSAVDKLKGSLQGTLSAIGPTIQKMMPGLISGASSQFVNISSYFSGLVVEGMEMLGKYDGQIGGWIARIREWFSGAASILQPFADAWDQLYQNIVSPVLTAIGSLVVSYLEDSRKAFASGSTAIEQWGMALKSIIKSFRVWISAFNNVKKIMAPFVTMVLKITAFLGKMLNLPIVKIFVSWGIAFFLAKMAIDKVTTAFTRGAVGVGQWLLGQQKATTTTREQTTALNQQIMALREYYQVLRMEGGSRIGSALGAKNALTGGGFAGKMNGAAMTAMLVGGLLGNTVSEHSSKNDATKQALGGALSGAAAGVAPGLMLAMNPVTAPIAPYVMAGGAIIGGVAGAYSGATGAVASHEKEKDRSQAKIFDDLYGGREATSLKKLGRVQKNFKKKKVITDQLLELNKQIEGKNEGGGGIGSLIQRSGDIVDVPKNLFNAARNMNNGANGNSLSVFDSKKVQDTKKLEAKRDKLEKQLGVESGTGAAKAIEKIDKKLKIQEKFLKINENFTALVGKSADNLGNWAEKAGVHISEATLSIKNLQKMTGFDPTKSDAYNLAKAAPRINEVLSKGIRARVDSAQSNVDYINAATSYFEGAKAPQSKEQTVLSTGSVVTSLANAQSARFAAGGYMKDEKGNAEDIPYQAFVTKTQRMMLDLINQAIRQNATPTAIAELTEQVRIQSDDLVYSLTNYSTRMMTDPFFQSGLGEQIASASSVINSGVNAGGDIVELMGQGVDGIRDWLGTQGIDLGKFSTQEQNAIYAMLQKDLTDTGVILRNNMKLGGKDAADLISKAFPGWVGRTTPPGGQELGLTAEGLKSYGDTMTALGYTLKDGIYVKSGGDTSTPRFQRTMASHGALDSMTSGKRMITSGIRTNNLGSINSDHLTGRAYDLTGQNLGAYASNVKATGGFAEFHGVDSTRHLHVVPGAVGDTASPVSIGMGGPAGTVNYYNNIVVNPPPGSSPEAIANEVMTRIAVRQRDSLERQ